MYVAVEVSPSMATIMHLSPSQLRHKAMTLIQDRKFSEALRVFDSILALSDDTRDYLWRAKMHLSLGNYAKSLQDYQIALDRLPDHCSSLHHAALIRAACPDGDLRDGPLALKMATRALELSRPDDWRILSVIAAAHAECGNFARATEVIHQVLRYAPPESHRRFLSRLQQYQQHEPFRISAEFVQSEMKAEVRCAKCGAPTFFSIDDSNGGRIYACIKCAEYDAEAPPTSGERGD